MAPVAVGQKRRGDGKQRTREAFPPASKALRAAVRRDRKEMRDAQKLDVPLGGTLVVGKRRL